MFDTTHPDKYLSTVTLGHLVSAETGIYQLAELGRRAGGRLDILAKSKTNKQKKQALKVTYLPSEMAGISEMRTLGERV